jgi:hypothetical protein
LKTGTTSRGSLYANTTNLTLNALNAADLNLQSATGIVRVSTNSVVRFVADTAGNVFIGNNTVVGQNTGGLTIQGKDIELMLIMGAYY